YASPAGLVGCHCVAAIAGLRPCAPDARGKSPCEPLGPRSSFFLVYQSQLSIRGQGASMPLATRLESSKRCYWLCQTSGWNEWAGTTPAALPETFNWVRYAHKSQKAKKLFRPQAAKNNSSYYGFSRPSRASPPVKKSGSHARMTPGKDRATGRALRSVGVSGFFQPGSAGTRAREDCKETLLLHRDAGPVF